MSNSYFRTPIVPRYVFPFIGGFLYAAGFPMTFAPNFFIFPIIGITLLFYSFGFIHENANRSLFQQCLSLLAFSVSYSLLGYYWIPYTLSEFGEVPFPFNYTLGVLFSLIIVPQYWVFILGHKVFKKFNFKSSYFVNSTSRRNLLFALVLTLVEYFTPQQFPPTLGIPGFNFHPILDLLLF